VRHNDKLIRLSAFHERGAVKTLEVWPDPKYFFNCASGGNYKRVRLLARGAEVLERSQAEEPATPKHAIGFHS
jgi:hypothetical protein